MKTITLKSSIGEVLNHLNKSVKILEGKSVRSFTELHELVGALANGVLDRLAFYKVWTVSRNGEDMFQLKLDDFVDDKRMKYGRAGRIGQLHFDCVIEGVRKSDSFEKALTIMQYNDKVKSLKGAYESIESWKKDIAKMQEYIKNTEEEVRELKKEMKNQ